jgi:hypothetical protein
MPIPDSPSPSTQSYPQGVISFIYHIMSDPDVQQMDALREEFRRAPGPVMTRFGLNATQQGVINNSWQAEPTDAGVQAVLALATDEVRALCPVVGRGGPSVSGTYPQGVIPFHYFTISNPDAAQKQLLRGELATSGPQLMSLFGLTPAQQEVVLSSWNGSPSEAQVQQVLYLATDEVKTHYDQAW